MELLEPWGPACRVSGERYGGETVAQGSAMELSEIAQAGKAEWAKRYRGQLEQVAKPDLNADKLADRIGGQARVRSLSTRVAERRPRPHSRRQSLPGARSTTISTALLLHRRSRDWGVLEALWVPVEIDTRPYRE